MSTVYPNEIDSDLEIPRVDQDVSEISGDTINSLRDAIFAIQQTIGINPQGNKSSFAERINVSIDANGFLKRSALEVHGLLTLPVTNVHVGTSAAIEETKLDLDYTTQFLRNLISSLQSDLSSLLAGLTAQTSSYNEHVLGAGSLHDGYSIEIGPIGIGGLDATTIGGAISELTSKAGSHFDLDISGGSSASKHAASEISINANNFGFIDQSASSLQSAIESIDSSSGILGIAHMDVFHDNGIPREVSSGTYYNPNRQLLGPVSGINYTEGTSIATIPGITSFASLNIGPGDILEIETQTGIADSGTYKIRAIGPLVQSSTLGDLPELDADQIAIFHVFSESRSAGDVISCNVYKPMSESSELSPLACAVRNNETIADTISVMNPGAARVVSVGFNGAILNEDGYSITIKAGIGGGRYRELEVTDLNLERLATNQARPVSALSVAERINAFVSDPDLGNNFPVSAYCVGNELAIAHNLVGTEYTIEILDGYTGNYPLGLDGYGSNIIGKETLGNQDSSYVVNGNELKTINTVFDGYASISTDSDSFALWTHDGNVINPLRYGIGPGSVMHIIDHETLSTNGSYTLLAANSTTVSVFAVDEIDAPSNPTTFDVLFTDSNVSLDSLESTETELGVIQIFVDINEQTFFHQRLMYGNSLGPAIEIIDVTDSFPVGSFSFLATLDGNFVDLSVLDGSLSGDVVRIHEDFKGIFKLYHSNGLDYLTIRIISGSIAGGLETIYVNESIAEDEAMVLCTAHFNGTLSITSMVDKRLFGNVGIDQARDDLVESIGQNPVSDLRSDGVARGFDLLDIPYVDSVTNMQAVPLRGGVAYVNGVRLPVETQKVVVHSYDEDGNTISNAIRVIGINDFGSIGLYSDTLGEMLTDGYISSSTFGKILPLYQVYIEDGNIDNIVDVRRFIDNLDNKINIIVDGSNNDTMVGNFRSLEGALLYASNYPGGEQLVVKIVNSVSVDDALVVPRGVSIVGDVPYGSNMHRITNVNNLGLPLLTLMGDNRLENIEVTSTVNLQSSLVYVSGPNVNIERCSLSFSGTVSTNSSDVAITVDSSSNVNIIDNIIYNVFSGIVSYVGCSDLVISDNRINGIAGTAGLPSGIAIGSQTFAVSKITISGNKIMAILPDISRSTYGIYVDIGEEIDHISIHSNSIGGDVNGSGYNGLAAGIRVSSDSDTANEVTHLSVTNNYINNVKLNSGDTHGMYFNDIVNLHVSDNTMSGIAVYNVSYSDTSYVWTSDNVEIADIMNNTFSEGEALKGIHIDSASTSASIIGNTLENIGDTDAIYIYGLGNRANVSNNRLVGPGDKGIWWRGERSKISGNHLSTPAPLINYAFVTGIYAQASYLDIVGNTVTDMTYDGSVGIGNANSANAGLKIVGNTVEGTKILNLINLNGNYHIISDNRLKNDLDATDGTVYVSLGLNSDGISIIGNVFEGIGTSCVGADDKVTNVSIMSNVVLTTALSSAPFMLINSEVANCMVAGNKLPDSSTYSSANTIGITPSYLVYNNNTIGINRGMLDTRGIHASAGVPSYESNSGDGYAGIPHWVFKDDNSYWEINNAEASSTRYLYFPIQNIPNGSSITSVQVQGNNVVQSGDSFVGQIFKRSVNETGLTITAVSDAKDLSTISGEFGNGDSGGLIDKINTTDDIEEVVNYSESNYYVRIGHSKSFPTSPSSIIIYGLTVSFRY